MIQFLGSKIEYCEYLKDSQKEKAPKTPDVLKVKQNFQKNKVVTGKTLFFVIDPFCSCHSTLASDRAVLKGNDVFSILVLSTKKQCSSFLKKVFIFQKICLKVKVLKTFKIFTGCHIKTCWSLKQRAILKISSTFFKRTYALSAGFKMKPLRKSIFQKNQLKYCLKLAKRSNHSFYWVPRLKINIVIWCIFWKKSSEFIS